MRAASIACQRKSTFALFAKRMPVQTRGSGGATSSKKAGSTMMMSEGGKKGGKVICNGIPEDIVKVNNSYTAKYLFKELN